MVGANSGTTIVQYSKPSVCGENDSSQKSIIIVIILSLLISKCLEWKMHQIHMSETCPYYQTLLPFTNVSKSHKGEWLGSHVYSTFKVQRPCQTITRFMTYPQFLRMPYQMFVWDSVSENMGQSYGCWFFVPHPKQMWRRPNSFNGFC